MVANIYILLVASNFEWLLFQEGWAFKLAYSWLIHDCLRTSGSRHASTHEDSNKYLSLVMSYGWQCLVWKEVDAQRDFDPQ